MQINEHHMHLKTCDLGLSFAEKLAQIHQSVYHFSDLPESNLAI